MEKEKIRPLYSELQGYLSNAPLAEKPHDSIGDESLWNQYNDTVNLLSKITEKDYSRFLIEPMEGGLDSTFIRIITYRQKLGGLISNLHGEFFSNEQAPFSGMPSTVISQTQEQNQSTYIQIVLDIQSKIDGALHNVKKGSKDEKFLEKFKSTLSTASTVNEILKLCFQLAKEYGIGAATLLKFFS